MKSCGLFPFILAIFLCVFATAGAQSPSNDAFGDAFTRLLLAGLEHDPRGRALAFSYAAARAQAREISARRMFDARAGADYEAKRPESGFEDVSGAFSASARASTLGPLGSNVSADISYNLSHTPSPGADTELSDSVTAGLGISLPVLANGRLFDTRLNKAGKRVAVDSALAEASETLTESRIAFVSGLMRQILDYAKSCRDSGLAERAAAIDSRDVEIARARYSSGALSFRELSEIERIAESDRLKAIDARASRRNLAAKLSNSTGIPVETLPGDFVCCPLPDSPGVFLSDLGGSAAKAADSLSSVVSASRAAKDAEAARILAGAEIAPKLSLSASYTRLLTHPDLLPASSDNPLSLSLGLDVDLCFLAAKSKVDAAKAQEKRALANLESSRSGAMADILDAVSRAESASAQAEYLESEVSAALSRTIELEAAVRSGTALQLDADRARLARDRAASDLETQRSAFFIALADIYALRGIDGTAMLADPAFGAVQGE